jgi:hypothetical protein
VAISATRQLHCWILWKVIMLRSLLSNLVDISSIQVCDVRPDIRPYSGHSVEFQCRPRCSQSRHGPEIDGTSSTQSGSDTALQFGSLRGTGDGVHHSTDAGTKGMPRIPASAILMATYLPYIFRTQVWLHRNEQLTWTDAATRRGGQLSRS